jgi:hypothetical protein
VDITRQQNLNSIIKIVIFHIKYRTPFYGCSVCVKYVQELVVFILFIRMVRVDRVIKVIMAMGLIGTMGLDRKK